MVMMLSMSLGVAAAGGLLSAFTHGAGGSAGASLQAFRASFAWMGLITATSAWVFWQLSPQASSARMAGKTTTEVP
jgi:hypothetical protein